MTKLEATIQRLRALDETEQEAIAAQIDLMLDAEDEAASDAVADSWIEGVIAKRYDAHVAGASSAISLDEARRRLLGGA